MYSSVIHNIHNNYNWPVSMIHRYKYNGLGLLLFLLLLYSFFVFFFRLLPYSTRVFANVPVVRHISWRWITSHRLFTPRFSISASSNHLRAEIFSPLVFGPLPLWLYDRHFYALHARAVVCLSLWIFGFLLAARQFSFVVPRWTPPPPIPD